MILARKLQSAVRLDRRDGLSTVAELAWDQSRGFLEANAIVPRGAKQQAALLSRVFNGCSEHSAVNFGMVDVKGCRPDLLFPYLRRQFFDVIQVEVDLARLRPTEIAIMADSMFRRWEFKRLDACLPIWQDRLAGTKFAPVLAQLTRRVSLRLGRLTEAADGLSASDGDMADFLLRGEIFDAQGRMEEAHAAFRGAIHRQSSDAALRLQYAFHLLKRGDLAGGLENWGLADRLMGSYPLRKRRLQWSGEDLGGRSLMVVFEHGLGDMIQMSRFLLPLQQAHPRADVIGCVPRPLVGFLERAFPTVRFIAAEHEEPYYDFYIPSFQLPLVLETESLEPTGGYVELDHFESAGPDRSGRKRVGICWRGHPRQYEFTRSVPVESFARLFDQADTDFVVLLNKLTSAEESFLERFDNVLRPDIVDFVGLGALVADCDLVISVDTAVVHVAGAGGKPVLMLSRPDACWRWGTEGPQSPWYSSVEVLRHPGDMNWDAVLAEAERRMRDRLFVAEAANL